MKKMSYEFNISDLKKIVAESDSLIEVTTKLGFNPKIGNVKKNIERLIKRNNISIEHFSTVKRVREYSKRYNKDKLIELTAKSKTLKEMLLELDILPNESSYKTLKKYLNLYEIDFSHIIKTDKTKNIICNTYEEINLRKIVEQSTTYKEVLHKLGLVARGNNYKTLKKYILKYNINVTHFNANISRVQNMHKANKIPIVNILVENSQYFNTNALKKRLYQEKLKYPICELCGQDENWLGKIMALILDHINGINNDNRIENLRIVCPNCNATLDTHCGKNKPMQK